MRKKQSLFLESEMSPNQHGKKDTSYAESLSIRANLKMQT